MISNDPHQVKHRRLLRRYASNERGMEKETKTVMEKKRERVWERVSGHLGGKLKASLKETRMRGII